MSAVFPDNTVLTKKMIGQIYKISVLTNILLHLHCKCQSGPGNVLVSKVKRKLGCCGLQCMVAGSNSSTLPVQLEMEGEKERLQRDEKESNEAENDRTSDEEEGEDSEGATLLWQEGYNEDNEGLPIMHWEALSLRIAELEKQEEERKEKNAKVSCVKSENTIYLIHQCG